MTSCEEAKFYIKNCPGTKMDGDGDDATHHNEAKLLPYIYKQAWIELNDHLVFSSQSLNEFCHHDNM